MFHSKNNKQDINNNSTADGKKQKKMSLRNHFSDPKYSLSPEIQKNLVKFFENEHVSSVYDQPEYYSLINEPYKAYEVYPHNDLIFLAIAEAFGKTKHHVKSFALGFPLLNRNCTIAIFDNIAQDEQIEELDLENCKDIFLGDENDDNSIKKSLQNLLKNKNLLNLNLARTNMPTHVLLALCEALPTSSLTDLNLSSNFENQNHEQILIALASAIDKNKTLQEFTISEMNFTATAYDAFSKLALQYPLLKITTENCKFGDVDVDDNYFSKSQILSRLSDDAKLIMTTSDGKSSISLAQHFCDPKYSLSPLKQQELISLFSNEKITALGKFETDQNVVVDQSNINGPETKMRFLAMAEAFGHARHYVRKFCLPYFQGNGEFICILLKNITQDSRIETLSFYKTKFANNNDSVEDNNVIEAFKSLIKTSVNLKYLDLIDIKTSLAVLLAVCESLPYSSTITELCLRGSIKPEDGDRVVKALISAVIGSKIKRIVISNLDFNQSTYDALESLARQSPNLLIVTEECTYNQLKLKDDHFTQLGLQFRNNEFMQQRLAQTKAQDKTAKGFEEKFKDAFTRLVEAGVITIDVKSDDKKSATVVIKGDTAIIHAINKLIKAINNNLKLNIKNEAKNSSSLTIPACKESILSSLVDNNKFMDGIKKIPLTDTPKPKQAEPTKAPQPQLSTLPAKLPTVCDLAQPEQEAWVSELKRIVCQADEVKVTWDGSTKTFSIKLPLGIWHIRDGSGKRDSEAAITAPLLKKEIITRYLRYLTQEKYAKVTYDEETRIVTITPYETRPPSLGGYQASTYEQLATKQIAIQHATTNKPNNQNQTVSSFSTSETQVQTITKQEQSTASISAADRAKSLFNAITEQELSNQFNILTVVPSKKKTKNLLIFTFKPEGAPELSLIKTRAGHRVKSVKLMESIANAINEKFANAMQVDVKGDTCTITLIKGKLEDMQHQLSEIKKYFAFPYNDVTEDTRRKEGKEEMELPEVKATETISEERIKLEDFLRQQIRNLAKTDENAKKENNTDCSIIANLHYHITQAMASKPSDTQETSKKEIIYYNFILHSYRVLEIITHKANDTKAFKLLRDYRNVLRHAYSVPNWQEMYRTFEPLFKALYSILLQDNSKRISFTAEDQKRLQENLQRFEEHLQDQTLSSITSNTEKAVFADDLRQKLEEFKAQGISDEKTKNALLAKMMIVGEFELEKDTNLRALYRMIGHDIRTPFAQLAKVCFESICPSPGPAASKP